MIFERQQTDDTERKLHKVQSAIQKDLENLEELRHTQHQYAREREGLLEELKGQRKQLQERRDGNEKRNQLVRELKREAALLLEDLMSLQKSYASKVRQTGFFTI